MSIDVPLTDVLGRAEQNARATRSRFPDLAGRLDQTHRAFSATLELLSDQVAEPYLTPLAVAYKSHEYLISSAYLAMSTFVAPTFATTRASVEAALYAHYVFGDTELQTTYLHRSDSDKARTAARKAFGNGKPWKHLLAAQPHLHGKVRLLYERCIDHGAHPNADAILAGLCFTEAPESTQLRIEYFARSDAFRKGLLTHTLLCGAVAFELVETTFEAFLPTGRPWAAEIVRLAQSIKVPAP